MGWLRRMDPFTHAALGVAAAVAVAGRETNLRHAALAGLAAGLLPDIDIFLREPGDPLAIFRWHRHFTHSFAFTPVLALAGAALAWLPLFRRGPRYRDLIVPAWAAALAHLLNDAGTSYGTMLLWPFSRERVAWDILPIVDPVFLTGPLLLLALVAIRRRSRAWAFAALAWMTAYAGFGYAWRGRAEKALMEFAAARGDAVARFTVKPAPLSPILWRGVYESGGRVQAVAIRPGLVRVKLWPGDSATLLREGDPANPAPGTRAGGIVEELRAFSGGWLTATPLAGGRTLIGDARFSLLPHGVEPLWGVTLRPGHDDELPLAYMCPRDAGTPYGTFFGMILDNADAPAWAIVR